MSIKIQVNGYGSGYFKRLEGRLMTLLESLGLESKQERAIKDLVRNEIWSMWDFPAYSETKTVTNPTVIDTDSQ